MTGLAESRKLIKLKNDTKSFYNTFKVPKIGTIWLKISVNVRADKTSGPDGSGTVYMQPIKNVQIESGGSLQNTLWATQMSDHVQTSRSDHHRTIIHRQHRHGLFP